MAMRKFKITLVSYKIFLMDSTALEICHLLQPYNFLQVRKLSSCITCVGLRPDLSPERTFFPTPPLLHAQHSVHTDHAVQHDRAAHVKPRQSDFKTCPTNLHPTLGRAEHCLLGECGLGTTVSYAQEGSSFFILYNVFLGQIFKREILLEFKITGVSFRGSDILYSIREDTQCGSCFIVDSYFAWSSHTFHSVSFIRLQIITGDLTHIRHCVRAPVTS